LGEDDAVVTALAKPLQIETIAGNGIVGFSGDGGPAVDAQLDSPQGIAVGPDGSVYISDYDNDRIRKINPDGIITTFAGSGERGEYCIGEGAALSVALNGPFGISVAPDGTVSGG
jgi:serine/threonine-protein kinase